MIRGALFSRYYLDDGIRETEAYRTLNPAHLTEFIDIARGLWRNLAAMRRPSEAETESEFIFPMQTVLGQGRGGGSNHPRRNHWRCQGLRESQR